MMVANSNIEFKIILITSYSFDNDNNNDGDGGGGGEGVGNDRNDDDHRFLEMVLKTVNKCSQFVKILFVKSKMRGLGMENNRFNVKGHHIKDSTFLKNIPRSSQIFSFEFDLIDDRDIHEDFNDVYVKRFVLILCKKMSHGGQTMTA
ncbi:hypothetical protein SSS_05657 [Sarcoptes scabiei]|uniref:Uncharacterized protein n=1 Tax=Sarcoptes scabiei TaxID=52283 RepID=A0A834R8S8_SARSC|nr:hypothetical protein SSS_05657 [Sarcoptes scabiei]